MTWYQRDPKRFEIEKHILRQRHPGVKLVIKNGKVSVFKKYTTRRQSYLIEGKFPKNYPFLPLAVFIVEPPLKKAPPHQFRDKRLCLHRYNEQTAQLSCSIFLDWAVQWLNNYEKWLEGNKWPANNKSY